MLERIGHDNGVVTYESRLLREVGVCHAFSTRVGGCSEGPYATLNLGRLEKDPRTDGNTNVAENYRRLRHAIGCERMMRLDVRQVHGAEVWRPPAKPVRSASAPHADAIVTNLTQRMLTVRCADCVPVLLAERRGEAIAAVHAGWRGLVAGVVGAAARRLGEEFDVAPTDLIAAIGPCIGVEAYEVGAEVVEAFESAGLGEAVRRRDEWIKPHVDLRTAAARQLERAGVPAERIDTTDRCTHRDADEFFSFRRDRGVTGHMAAVIAIPAALRRGGGDLGHGRAAAHRPVT